MKIKFYPFILTAILAVVNIFLFYRIINFDSKFDTLKKAVIKLEQNKQPLDKEILIDQFKEEAYIRQQERDTNLILLVFTLFAGFTAFLTFRSFASKVEEHTTAINENYIRHKAEYDEQHNIILELKSRIDLEAAMKYDSMAHSNYQDKFYDYYLDNMLYSLRYYTDYFLYSTLLYPESKGLYLSEQVSTLKEVYKKIKNKNVSGVSSYSSTVNLNLIRQFQNKEINQYLDLISAKIIKDTEKKKASE